jgi:hypothetical protein
MEEYCMNYKILLRLMAVPAVSSSLLASCLFVGNTSKAQAASSQLSKASCSVSQPSTLESPNIQSLLHRKSSLLIASAAGSNVVQDEFSVDFSEAESDAAVALFGCDCPACMNVLSQLRRQARNPKGEGHCMTNLARRVTPEKAQEILKTLDADEAKSKP